MKVSFNWLKNYIQDENITVEEVIEKLTKSGLEVEEVVNQSEVFNNIVIAQVNSHAKHPNAEKLSVCKVFDGKEELSVVCGAPNVAQGQKVILAKTGAVIPSNQMEIKKVKLRGQESNGMLCSERELGLSDKHEGIVVLPESVEVGQSISDYLGMNDFILDLNVTPNRADAFSHVGVCRDLAALFNTELKLPEINFTESEKHSSDYASVEIHNKNACPRYVAKIILGVEVKESPEWLKKKLKNIGLRPINNVVDVTNFVLHEIGQPLHAFDLDKLAGQKIIVRNASEGEKFITLDSKERILSKSDLMICDGEKAVAIAGVMGGENSEVTSSTKNILIESAYFNPSSIRRTSKRLGLSTDASTRFERGCDPEIVVWAANRAAQLIKETAGGEILKDIIDVYPEKIIKKTLQLRESRIEKIIGIKIPLIEAKNILFKLGFGILEFTNEKLTVEVPTFRPDIEREIDLIEEVARIYGFDNIPLSEKINVTLDEKIDQTSFNDNLRKRLVALGLNEIISNSLLSEEIALRFGNAIRVLSPQSAEMSHARPSLLPGMLITISKNLKVKESNLSFFEIGHTFIQKNSVIDSFDDFAEHEHLLIAMTGKANEAEWYEKERFYDFYDIKGIVSEILNYFNPKEKLMEIINPENSLAEYSIQINSSSNEIVSYGKIKKEIAKEFDINQDVFFADFNLSNVKELTTIERSFDELLKFPKVKRDFAFIFGKKTTSSEIIQTIKDSCSALLKNVKLFDIFESESIGKNNISMAFELEFFSAERTLTEEEVDKEFWNAIEVIKNKYNAKLRGS